MKDVDNVNIEEDYVFLDTGSPHHVQLVDDLKNYPIKEKGAEIRYGKLYGQAGSNVNFVHQNDTDTFSVRTYERGVEDETLSCGTGATAVAIAMNNLGKTEADKITIKVEGGDVQVSFDQNQEKYYNVMLTGAAKQVFKGEISVD